MSADAPAEAAPKPPLTVLEEAGTLVKGQRQNDYGAPDKCLKRMAKAITVALASLLPEGVELTPHHAAAVMEAVKLARLGQDPTHRDTWVDIAGYASLIDYLEGTK